MIDTNADPAAECDPVEAAQQDAQLWAAFQKATHDLSACERELLAIDAKRAAIMDAGRGSIAEQVRVLNDLEQPRAEILLRLGHQRNLWLLLSDRAQQVQVRGRSAHIAELQEQIAGIEAQEREFMAGIAECQRRIEDLTVAAEPLAEQLRALVQQAHELEPRSAKHVKVNMRGADAFRPPAGVLITGTAWHAFIEDARSRGVTDQVHIVVNELTGEIVRSSLDD